VGDYVIPMGSSASLLDTTFPGQPGTSLCTSHGFCATRDYAENFSVEDGLHPSTVIQGLLANEAIAALNGLLDPGDQMALLTDQEIIAAAVPEPAADPCEGSGGDSDADGICDDIDTCPGIGNALNNTDTNGDGIGDYCQCGDVNGDGTVNNVDSILVKRADLGLSVGGSYNPALCDVNGDGNCNNVDSILIKRADLGLSVGGSFQTVCAPMP
jgi:hypothetical protein